MKFQIHSTVFKNITERAAIACNKKTPLLAGLWIKADKENQTVTVQASNLESFAEVHTYDVIVIEGGSTCIDADYLKRLYNVAGEMTVEATEETIKVKNSKKQSEVRIMENDEIEFPDMCEDAAFSADKQEIIDTFSKLSCCLSGNDTRPILTGFNVAYISGKNRIASCDAYRLAMRNVDWNFRENLNITVPGDFIKKFQKVSANKEEEKIQAFANNKHIWFVGEDFTYITRLLDGNYFDVDSLMEEKQSVYSFKINANNLFSIAKEYSNILKGTGKPMFVCHVNGEFVTAAMNHDYRTSDFLETTGEYGVPDESIQGFNPNYIKDITGIFEKDDVVILVDSNGKYPPWKFIGKNGYSSLILPVNIKGIDVDSVIAFAQDHLAAAV